MFLSSKTTKAITKTNSLPGRLPWIDFLRGIAIILVVIGHRIGGENAIIPYFIYTSPIKMPLFFILSGYLFNIGRVNFLQYLNKLLSRLILPWFLLTLIPYIFLPTKLPSVLLSLIKGEIAWFFPCLIIDSIIVYSLLKYCKNRILIISISIFLIIIGQLLTYFHSPNIWMINTALVCQSYMIGAYYFKEISKKFFNTSYLSLLFLTILYIFLCYIGYTLFGIVIDVHLNRYYNAFLCIPTIIIGCFVIFIFSKKYIKTDNVLSFLGKNTLVIYIWDGICNLVILKLFEFLKLPVTNYWVLISIGIIDCFILATISMLLRRYCPFLIGEKKKNGKIDQIPNL